MSSEPTEGEVSNQENTDEIAEREAIIRDLSRLQRAYEAQVREKAKQQAQQANQEANQEKKKKKSEVEKELEELCKLQKMSASQAFKTTLEAPSKAVREAVKSYTEENLHFPFEEPVPPPPQEEEEEKEEGKKGRGKGKKKKKSRKKPSKKEQEEQKSQEQQQKQQQTKLPLRDRLKKAISNFTRKKAPILARKAVENIPPPPTPYGEATEFVESVIINVPKSREENLLMAYAMLAGMYGIAGVLIFIDNSIVNLWQQQLGRVLVFLMAPIILIHLITGFLMWFTLYMTTFSSISAIFTNIASKIWTQANYHHTLSLRAVMYYALAMVLYMATTKVWVGMAVGYFTALLSFLFFKSMQNIIVTLLIFIAALTLTHIVLGVPVLIYAILALIYLVFFLVFSILSMFWSRYTTNSMDIHRPLAVWLILAVRELLAPQMAYLAVAGFAIYAGIQAALSVGTQRNNYRYLNMLPALIILATAPMGTVNMLLQIVINATDQAFQYMATIDRWNFIMVSAQGLAKWLLAIIPPW